MSKKKNKKLRKKAALAAGKAKSARKVSARSKARAERSDKARQQKQAEATAARKAKDRERILSVRNLRTEFRTPDRGTVKAVRGIDFDLHKGEILGIVGESGSGKSVTNLSLMGLVKAPGHVTADSVDFDGIDLLALSNREQRKIRGKRIAMIFQDPMTSLNPFLTVGEQIMEAIRLHLGADNATAREKCVELFKQVGIPDPVRRVDEYPHQFSGGMRQRVMIAMALSCDPEILIADEPTTALDVTIQAQILDLLKSIRRKRRMSVILITHDLGVVAGTCDRVLVMYAGRIVEKNTTGNLFRDPGHPYTDALLRSIPRLDDGTRGELEVIEGLPPDLSKDLQGCAFEPRCDWAEKKCKTVDPSLEPWNVGARACYVKWHKRATNRRKV